ncbi:MAG: SH3 domain-containing protein [Methylophaga sp.]|nr:SH3 domain-containing protein [Methylophaga sp.]
MMERMFLLATALFMTFLVTGCASISPTYINDGEVADSTSSETTLNPVHFKRADSFKTSPPNCIAVLPLHNGLGVKPAEDEVVADSKAAQADLELNNEALEQLRWNLYAHLAPYPYRDIELEKVNEAVLSFGNDSSGYAAIAADLKCEALLLGEVIDYRSEHFGLYSQISIGIRMQLIRASNNEMLWQGHHIAKSQGGAVPLTPIDIVVGIYSATENVSDEQLVRVEDDLFRRLLSTWDTTAPLQDNHKDIQLAEQEEPSELVKEDGYPYSISVENLYLRSGPGVKFSAQRVLNQQDKLVILDHKHAPWVQVKVANGQLGYVNKKYIQPVEELSMDGQLVAFRQ